MLSRRHRRPLRHRLLTAPAVLLAAVLALTACSSSDDDGGADPTSAASTSAGAPADLSQVTVTDPAEGATGAAAVPTVTVPAGFTTGETTSEVLVAGDEAQGTVATGEVVTVEFVGVNGASGEQFGASGWSGQPVSFVLGSGVIPGFTKALDGAAVGSRVLTAVAPADGYGAQGGLPQAQIGAEDTLVYLIQVLAVAPGWAEGTPVDPSTFPAGLPSVTVDPDTHVPTIEVDSAATPPTELVSQTLVEGSGPAVQAGQRLTMQYTGTTWSTGETFDSSWSRGAPFEFTLGQGEVIPGWDQGLVGKTVGSQVLLVIPPDLGYGDRDTSEQIPPGSTLVFVVDVLAAQ